MAYPDTIFIGPIDTRPKTELEQLGDKLKDRGDELFAEFSKDNTDEIAGTTAIVLAEVVRAIKALDD